MALSIFSRLRPSALLSGHPTGCRSPIGDHRSEATAVGLFPAATGCFPGNWLLHSLLIFYCAYRLHLSREMHLESSIFRSVEPDTGRGCPAAHTLASSHTRRWSFCFFADSAFSASGLWGCGASKHMSYCVDQLPMFSDTDEDQRGTARRVCSWKTDSGQMRMTYALHCPVSPSVGAGTLLLEIFVGARVLLNTLSVGYTHALSHSPALCHWHCDQCDQSRFNSGGKNGISGASSAEIFCVPAASSSGCQLSYY